MNRHEIAKQARADYLSGRHAPAPLELYEGVVAALADACTRVPYHCVQTTGMAFLEDLAEWHAAVLHRIDCFEMGEVSSPAYRLPPNAIHQYRETTRRISEIGS